MMSPRPTTPHATYREGLTLVELMVAISLIAILSTISIFGLAAAREAARDNQRLTDMQALESAFEQFYLDYGRYPGEPDGVPITGQKIGVGERIDELLAPYLERVPKDPLHDPNDDNPEFYYAYDGQHIVHLQDCDQDLTSAPSGGWDQRPSAVYGFRRSETGFVDIETCQGQDQALDDAHFNRVLPELAPDEDDLWNP